MKIYSIVGLILLSVLIGPVAATAQTTVIDDTRDGPTTYYGGTAPGVYANQDVIPGDTLEWDIDSMVVTVTGATVDVKVIGPWFSPVYDPGTDLSLNAGDLYLSSTGWNHTNDSPHFPTDTFTQAEGWNFVVTQGRYDNVLGKYFGAGVYVLDYSKIKMTDPTYGTSLGRANQAYWNGYGTLLPFEGATVTFNNTLGADSYMEFQFNNFLSGDVGLHWTMYCGNDVVEGQASFGVPEPGAFLLLGFGLAGLGLYRRRWLASSI